MRPGRGGAALALLLAVAFAGVGCATLRALYRAPRIPECAGALVPTDQLPETVFLHLRVRVRGDGVDTGLQLVASREGGALALVGLNAFGAKVFTLEQRGVAIEERLDVAQILGVPPANLLRDLHRAHFFGLPHAPLADGIHRGVVAGVGVEERWEGGRLQQRRVEDGPGPAQVRFTSPRDYDVAHPRCGYAAVVRRID